jgi:hypothetical protein
VGVGGVGDAWREEKHEKERAWSQPAGDSASGAATIDNGPTAARVGGAVCPHPACSGRGREERGAGARWLKSKKNSLEILRTLKFNKIWLASSLLHLIKMKNKFSAKNDQKFEFPLKMKFRLILL